ncbi:hypothetical protein [Sphingobium aquiterrae]|uniref:hypothetical protein n=1 Tax=Sphingobium aquiterrae TaxID=2038656 RepID=UPI003018AB4E
MDETSQDLGAFRSPSPWNLLRERLQKPCKEWSFYIFLGVGILFLGGMAIWIEAYRFLTFVASQDHPHAELSGIRLALATAILAIAGPAAMQLMYALDKMATVVAILLIAVELVLAIYLMGFGSPDGCGTILWGFIGLGLAVLTWWLANGGDNIFQDETPDDAATGGNPTRPLLGGAQRPLPGGTSNVQV